MRFDPSKVLPDPYGRCAVVPKNYSRDAARQAGDNTATAMKSVVVDGHTYDWKGDTPLQRPSSRIIVYEMHVRGFTRHPNSGVTEQTHGTFAGLIVKIPYLQQLGITAAELLPVFQCDAQDAPPGKVNYWGYAPVAFFAPHQAYSSRQDPERCADNQQRCASAQARHDGECAWSPGASLTRIGGPSMKERLEITITAIPHCVDEGAAGLADSLWPSFSGHPMPHWRVHDRR